MNRHGFTLIELLGVLVITAVIAAGVWSVTESVTRGQARSMEDADRSATVASVERVLRDAIRQATAGTLAAPNAGPIQVVVAESDTLLLLRAEGVPMTVSTRPCPGGGACLHMVGDHAGVLKVGEVLLVSAPAMGARVYRVGAGPRATRAPCGADCPEEVACPTFTDEAAADAEVVTASVVYAPGAPASPRSGPCEQTYYADGSHCAEVRTTVSAARRNWRCEVRGTVSAYTEVPVVEVDFHFPAGAPPGQSGAALTPRVRAQRVTPSRFYVSRAGARSAPLLVRQTGLDGTGTWNSATPVGGPVSALEVETLHAGETTWRRGVGVDDVALEHSTANPNYAYAFSATGEPGFAFRRGYHDVGAVRVRFTVPTERADGTVAQVAYSVVVATNGATRGGSEGGW
ncbi:MAG TPA: prepilin-type N-terminal cleavage/methylation domain-containing protein [Longimicrobium sp.]|jgi:prepilin-type N-terminal cleavage/methylation domain-containing protein